MKRFLLFILALVVLAGCSKQEIEEIDIWNGYQNYKIDMTVPLMAGQNIEVGTVKYDMTGGNFIATYTITGGWTMAESHLYAGDYDQLPVNKPGAPKVGKFPFKETHNPAVTTYTYTIPCVDLPSGNTGFVCAAHCVVNNPNGGDETGWASGNETFSDKGWGTYTSDFYAIAMDITIIYGIVYNNDNGTLTLLHIDGQTHIGEVILAETIAITGIVDAAAYDPLTGDLFFVIGNDLYVNNLNGDEQSQLIGTLPGLASGGVFIDGNYYYLDIDPNSPTYNQIVMVELVYDDASGDWSILSTGSVSPQLPDGYGVVVSDIAYDGNNIYVIGTNDNGTPLDFDDDAIYLVIYDIDGGTWSGNIPAELIGYEGSSPQIAFGADGNLYAVDVNESGETVMVILDPNSGMVIPTANDGVGVGDGEEVIDITPGPVK